jgi:hypothetical protein
MAPWVRNGLVFGAASGMLTVLVHWVEIVTANVAACQETSPLPDISPLAFVALMTAAGFLTTAEGRSVGSASLAGLVAAFVSAGGTLLALALELGFMNAQCLPAENARLAWGLLAGFALAITIAVSVLGLGMGAGLGAIGGVLGRSRAPRHPSAPVRP